MQASHGYTRKALFDFVFPYHSDCYLYLEMLTPNLLVGNLGVDRGRCARAASTAQESSCEKRHAGDRSVRCLRDWREQVVLGCIEHDTGLELSVLIEDKALISTKAFRVCAVGQAISARSDQCHGLQHINLNTQMLLDRNGKTAIRMHFTRSPWHRLCAMLICTDVQLIFSGNGSFYRVFQTVASVARLCSKE